MIYDSGLPDDPYHRALFYLLGIFPETRSHFKELFNTDKDEINPDALHKPWQTGGTMRITRTAFNLFNGFDGSCDDRKIEPVSLYTLHQLIEPSLMECYFEACRLRYGAHRAYEYRIYDEEMDEPEWE